MLWFTGCFLSPSDMNEVSSFVLFIEQLVPLISHAVWLASSACTPHLILQQIQSANTVFAVSVITFMRRLSCNFPFFVVLSTVGDVGLTKFWKELFFIFRRIFFYDRLILGFFPLGTFTREVTWACCTLRVWFLYIAGSVFQMKVNCTDFVFHWSLLARCVLRTSWHCSTFPSKGHEICRNRSDQFLRLVLHTLLLSQVLKDSYQVWLSFQTVKFCFSFLIFLCVFLVLGGAMEGSRRDFSL